MKILYAEHPAPWRLAWTSFGESKGYDSRSRILDANGLHVVTIGDGSSDRRKLHEQIAAAVVSAANGE